MRTDAEIKKEIEKKLSNLDIDIDLSEFTSFDGLKDYVQDNNLLDGEIIYYSNAIKYLAENDASLRDSLEIAAEYGYSVENLSSEVLASLLYSRNLENEFYELEDKIASYYDDVENVSFKFEDKISELRK